MRRRTEYLVKGFRDNDNTIWCKYTAHASTMRGVKKTIQKLITLGYSDFEITRQTYIRF